MGLASTGSRCPRKVCLEQIPGPEFHMAMELAPRCFAFATLEFAHETQVSLTLPPRQTQQTDVPLGLLGLSQNLPQRLQRSLWSLSPGEPQWLCGFAAHPGSREGALGSRRPDGCG